MAGGDVRVEALRGLSIEFTEGESVAVCGASGSGKSTLMNMLGCLDRPTSGRYLLGGLDVSRLSDDQLSDIRGQRIGFIFQNFNLVPQLTVAENLEVPLLYQGCPRHIRRARALETIEMVGLVPVLGVPVPGRTSPLPGFSSPVPMRTSPVPGSAGASFGPIIMVAPAPSGTGSSAFAGS